MTLQEIKASAKLLGVKWRDVEAVYRELRSQQEQDREIDWQIRQLAWNQYATTEDRKRWWRYGMAESFPRAFGEGDRTMIPRFDEVADGIAMTYPQLLNNGDASEALFELLSREWVRVPSADETYKQALDLIAGDGDLVMAAAGDSFDFGFNVAF